MIEVYTVVAISIGTFLIGLAIGAMFMNND